MLLFEARWCGGGFFTNHEFNTMHNRTNMAIKICHAVSLNRNRNKKICVHCINKIQRSQKKNAHTAEWMKNKNEATDFEIYIKKYVHFYIFLPSLT